MIYNNNNNNNNINIICWNLYNNSLYLFVLYIQLNFVCVLCRQPAGLAGGVLVATVLRQTRVLQLRLREYEVVGSIPPPGSTEDSTF